MKFFFFIWMLMLPIEGYLKVQDWVEYNSSLLIEVTRPNGVFTCTGVAVSKEVIITAAHCLDGLVLKVRVFTQDKYDPKQSFIEVKDFKLNPGYHSSESRYESDLAKIRLTDKLPDYINIQSIDGSNKTDGQFVRFGFGGRDAQNVRTAITPKFRQISGTILELFDFYSYSGDSGGPIFLKRDGKISLVAIHSTLSFGPEGNFSFNPLLAPYRNWIFEN